MKNPTDMNAELFLTTLAVLLSSNTASAGKESRETTDSLTRELQEIVVTARHPETRLEGTTLVSTIAGSGLADLGNALDVLSRLPMIEVHDNAVSVTGKSNIEIYIDGRPMHDGNELHQILSSDMKKVELLMAPGAAYAGTTDAVLKITTKKNFAQGLSLAEQFQLQKRRKWSVTDYLGLNYRTGSWDFFLNGSINRDNSVIKGTTVNTLVYAGKETVVGSSQHNTYPATAGSMRMGINRAKGNRAFGAYYRYNPERGNPGNTGSEWLDNEIPLERHIKRDIRSDSHLLSAYYEDILAGQYTLHFDGDFRHSNSESNTSTIYPFSDTEDVQSTSDRASSLLAGKLYITFPLGKGAVTAGTQDSHTHTTLDYKMLNNQVGAYIPSSLTDARQTSAALFASWTAIFGKLNLTAGARYEYVDYDFSIDGKRDDETSHRDHLLTPDISLGYTFNEDTQLSMSYKISTVKPPYSQLTGSLSYVGRHEIEGGNPSLRDEHMHDIQLFGMWNGFMFQADLQRGIDTYAYVKELYPADNLQLLMHPVNIDVTALFVSLIWSRQIRNWTPNLTLGMYRQWLEIGHIPHNRPIFSYSLDNTFTLPGGWMITADISGQTKGDMHTNRFGTTWFTMNASLGKTFLNKSMTVRLNANDIFNTANNDWTMNTCGISVDKRQSYDRRNISLNITYRFNPRKDKYKGNSASEAEMRRL